MIEREEIARCVREATADVFGTMLGLEIVAGPAREDSYAPAISDGVLSVVGLAGPWTGAGCVACSATFACRICAALLMTEADSVNEDVLDAVGEVTNMIIGNFKTMAEERLGAMCLSIPTVIYGRNFTSRSIGQTDWIVMPFECEGETLEIRVCLAPSKESGPIRGGYSHASAIVG
jgi:chemotaxis protein CheX